MEHESRPSYGVDARDLRVSDTEREHVAGLLQKAVGRGMLSLGEFTERVDTALAARTRGELNAVIIDLPGLELRGGTPLPGPPAGPAPGVAATGPTSGPRPSAGPAPELQWHPGGYPVGDHSGDGQPVVLHNTMSTVTRKGDWPVPERMRIVSKFSTIKLNYARVSALPPVIHLDIDDYGSTVHLILPPGATADVRELRVSAGTVKSDLPPTGRAGSVHLILTGHTRIGTVNIRYSRGRRAW